MNRKNPLESGQLVVILAVVFVVLLGFGALAVDVGMTYADRRVAQNAADAAVLAGAQKLADQLKNTTSFNCAAFDKTNAATATKARALANGYSINLNATENSVAFACPPSGNAYIDVKVSIATVSKTSFIQLFYGGEMKNTVVAVSRVFPRQPAAAGFLVYTLDPDCSSSGIDWKGTVDAYLFDGGAYTRSCLSGNGNTTFTVMDPGQTTASCNATASTSTDYTVGCSSANQASHPAWCNDTKHFEPNPVWQADPAPEFSLPDISTCSSTIKTTVPAGSNFTPGTYQIGSKSWDGAKLAPGLYCIYGDISLQGNGATITSVDGPGANGGNTHGVTLYMIDGGISCKGNCAINLKAVAQNATNPPAGAIPGLVLMAKHGNTNVFTWGGNSGSSFGGTVYVPDGTLDLGGTGDMPTTSQFIAKAFKSHGNSQLCVKYDTNMAVNMPASFRLQQ